jgi:hypothetical protein
VKFRPEKDTRTQKDGFVIWRDDNWERINARVKQKYERVSSKTLNLKRKEVYGKEKEEKN